MMFRRTLLLVAAVSASACTLRARGIRTTEDQATKDNNTWEKSQ
jgi:hypothetical protein